MIMATGTPFLKYFGIANPGLSLQTLLVSHLV